MSIISKIASIFRSAPKPASTGHRRYGQVYQKPKNDVFEYVAGLQPKIEKYAKKNGVKIKVGHYCSENVSKRCYMDILSIEISKKKLFREKLVENSTFYNQPPFIINHKPFEENLFKELAAMIKRLKKK